MGTVYRALDSKLNRPVTMKVLSNDLADAAARRRFQREAQMASSLNHPHILTVHDVGEFEGRQYIVTEFIDGGTLKNWARAEKRGWRQVVDLLTGMADGLAAAHHAGILHRDIKPSNILVAKNGYAKLADFGLAKLQAQAGSEETATLTKVVMIRWQRIRSHPSTASVSIEIRAWIYGLVEGKEYRNQQAFEPGQLRGSNTVRREQFSRDLSEGISADGLPTLRVYSCQRTVLYDKRVRFGGERLRRRCSLHGRIADTANKNSDSLREPIR